MFKVSGSEESYQATISQIFTMFKQQYPDIEESILTDFEKEFSNESMKELSMLLVPIYKKYMTLSDLNEMIRFYKTPVGKKFAKNTPLIMQESTQIGQQWALEMGQVFEKKLKSKGYL